LQGCFDVLVHVKPLLGTIVVPGGPLAEAILPGKAVPRQIHSAAKTGLVTMTAMELSRDQVRAIDRRAIDDFGVPGVVLMENAGRGAAEVLIRLGISGPVIVCCGKGNNGGDGFVIARHLDNHGQSVRVFLFARPEELTGDAAVNYHIIEKAGLAITRFGPDVAAEALRRELAGAAWVVDALFGTGLSGPVRPPFDRVIEAVNRSGTRVLAVDIPSGLDCDTGQPLGPTVRAEHTVTFVARKKGFAAAKEWTGEVHVVDIGAPRAALR
jgi:NAD(P)H-hydrate epimerase